MEPDFLIGKEKSRQIKNVKSKMEPVSFMSICTFPVGFAQIGVPKRNPMLKLLALILLMTL